MSEELKPMVYADPFVTEILFSGSYKDCQFYVVSFGSHPCCYVRLPKGHPLFGLAFEEMDLNCHGGPTFAGHSSKITLPFENGFYIGWDYAHVGDYCSLSRSGTGKRWTTEELISECHEVIDELISAE